MLLSYYAAFIKEDNEYYVKFPDLPGCFSCGENIELAKKMAEEAMELHLHGWEIDDLPVKTEKFSEDDCIEVYILLTVELKVKDGKLFSGKVKKLD